ncbi:MAG: SURF1 family protein [Gammaproteobacteria bacterium]
MRVGAYEFKPGLWPSIATLVLLPGMIALGIWQLERAAWKQGLVDEHAARIQQAQMPVNALPDDAYMQQYRPVSARGRYDLEHQLLLDNRIYQQRPGYHVLTPLLLTDRDEAVLVNRGWVQLGPDRAVLPALPGPDGEVLVTAIIKLPPERIFRLDAVEEVHTGWPQVVQHVEIAQLEKRLGYKLIPATLLLDSAAAHGFTRDWQPVYDVPPDKHRAYAMQWFTLALVLLVIYIGVNSKRITSHLSREDDEQE